MDISNIRVIKKEVTNIKPTSNNDKKPVEAKQGCIKMFDYLAF